MVLDGHGERLLNETAGSNRVNKFLTSVRPLMIRIRELHSAAINGDSAKVEAMTEGQSRLLTSKDQNGLTILHKAAALGHRTIVETSLGTVRDQKDEPDNDGYTPLFYAAASQNKEIYDLLVKAGADVNRVDKRKKTAEYYREHPKEMPMQHVYQLPDAPRNSGDSLGVPDGPNRRRSVSTDRHQGGDGGQAAKGKRSTSRRETDQVSSDAAAAAQARLSEQDVTPGQVDVWIRQGDLEKLEQVLVDGHGDALEGKTAWNEQARNILKVAPTYMVRWRVERGWREW
ncbi:Ankyrin repeat-containing protein C6C3.08 [Amphibalanus amphitrite]|uniref:Ankyrin repeat-containing protein C6C3.08 n=1 Tax=Amphibalanus amphitrite TaxID=1232801 RepID=A0A6A4W7F6_AMPAM|nr:Ankyrin repeat-containing protein C6C3.08 [Amphibalanus amphitrite]